MGCKMDKVSYLKPSWDYNPVTKIPACEGLRRVEILARILSEPSV